MFDKTAHEKRAILLEKIGELNDALNEYEFINYMEPNNMQVVQKINDLKEKLHHNQ